MNLYLIEYPDCSNSISALNKAKEVSTGYDQVASNYQMEENCAETGMTYSKLTDLVGQGDNGIVKNPFKELQRNEMPEGYELAVPECVRCSLQVFPGEAKRMENQFWHSYCFTCANKRCHRSLCHSLANIGKGEVYCNHCYNKLFGPEGYRENHSTTALGFRTSLDEPSFLRNLVPQAWLYPAFDPKASLPYSDQDTCKRCGTYVHPTDLFRINDHIWHRQCFRCEMCARSIPIPSDSILLEEDVYCKRCYQYFNRTANNLEEKYKKAEDSLSKTISKNSEKIETSLIDSKFYRGKKPLSEQTIKENRGGLTISQSTIKKNTAQAKCLYCNLYKEKLEPNIKYRTSVENTTEASRSSNRLGSQLEGNISKGTSYSLRTRHRSASDSYCNLCDKLFRHLKSEHDSRKEKYSKVNIEKGKTQLLQNYLLNKLNKTKETNLVEYSYNVEEDRDFGKQQHFTKKKSDKSYESNDLQVPKNSLVEIECINCKSRLYLAIFDTHQSNGRNLQENGSTNMKLKLYQLRAHIAKTSFGSSQEFFMNASYTDDDNSSSKRINFKEYSTFEEASNH